MATRRATKSRGTRKASSWAMEVKKVYGELKKMGKRATLSMAMKECSKRRKSRK